MKLSICIPVYNVAPYIETCARSLFAQTYEDIEYVFVDDGSPDDSIAIVRRVLEEFPRRAEQVKIIRHDRNRGLIVARQTALKAATGDLITHCDPDDWLDADLYANVVRIFAEEAVDMVYFPFCKDYANGNRVEVPMRDCHGSVREFFGFADGMVGFNNLANKVFRRRIALSPDIECPIDIATGEDLCYVAQALPKCRRLGYFPVPAYHYRQHGNSMSRAPQPARVLKDLVAVYDVLVRNVPSELMREVRRQLTGSILYFGARSGVWRWRDMRLWRERHRQAGGTYDFAWLNAWGRRYMRLAAYSLKLARLYEKLRPGRIGYN